MHAHIVLAHPEPQSFNAHLARLAARSLEVQGWHITMSDLYGMGFDPCDRPEHYVARQDPNGSPLPSGPDSARSGFNREESRRFLRPSERSQIRLWHFCDLLAPSTKVRCRTSS
jgi:hypothetical protein